MNATEIVGRRLSGPAALALSAAVTVVAVAVVARSVDGGHLSAAVAQAGSNPATVAVAVVAFAFAFVLRAVAWRRVVPDLGLGQALAGIHLALGANHVLPLRLGEPLRVVSVVKRNRIGVEAATASTVTLRTADLVTMIVIGVAVGPSVFLDLVGPLGWALMVALAVAAVWSWRWLVRLAAGTDATRVARPGPITVALVAAAWAAESVVVRVAAGWAGIDLGWSDALVVTTVAVAAQIAAVAPGGFGTYEAAAVAAYVALGHDAGDALVAALAAHGLKTAYSLVGGAVALVVPSPGLVGRLRLARPAGERVRSAVVPSPVGGTTDDRPILLFMPAHDEEASVARCVRRAPSSVLGRPVEVLVVDDGSADRTADEARSAGAEVISLDRNRGLGAAVRVGLAEGVSRGASAIAFCDADGEYPPEELAALVGPILDGSADYVTGSRFLGHIEHMRPHRRIGNLVLTAWLSIVARRRITDGQTGYRAFSPAAAAEAEIIHDFNYAQVLTLDLLAKGFRFVEVPISYRFRTEGRSFVKLGPYLRRVVPAVYREVNT